ncbi:MAG: TolC family protein, partial [Defluviitaleaceae bacterium]|nr:TolC family protein [Defluviitaleaceae bacterium]
MKKWKFLVCLVTIAVMPIAYAIAATEPEDNTVTITYDEAVSLALADMLVVNDINIAIRDMELNRRFLTDEMERLNSGRGTLQTRAMEDMLMDIDMGLSSMRAAQSMIGDATDAALAGMQWSIAGIAEGASPEHVIALNTAVAGMVAMSAPDMRGQIDSLQHQRNELSREINRLREPERIEEMRRNTQQGLNEMDRTAAMLRMNQEQAQIAMEFGLRNMITASSDLNRMAELLEASIALSEQGLERMMIMYGVGLVSTNDLNTARHNLNQNRNQLDDLNRASVTLMQNMNYLLGQSLFQYTVIDFEREIPEMPEDLEAHITAILPTTHAVRLSQLDIDRAIDARWAYTGTRGNLSITAHDRQRALNTNRRHNHNIWRTYLTDEDEEIESIRTRIRLQESVERAQISHEQTIRSTEASLLRGYTELQTLQSQYEALQVEYARAHELLETVQKNYALGLVTQFEIEQTRVAILRAELDKEGLRNQKW